MIKIKLPDESVKEYEEGVSVKAGILKNSPLICMPNGIIIRFENNFDKDTEIDSIVW